MAGDWYEGGKIMSNPIRVLYVDDYPLDRELVRDALEKEHGGFRVTEAASRQEFEARLAEGGYDLILSDFNILGFEGLEVIDAIWVKDPRVPVVIVTGTGSEEVAVEAMKRGAADYVIKSPRHIRRLPYTIQAVLEKKRLEDERQRAEEALRESEERFRDLYENAPNAYFSVGVDGRIRRCNRRAGELLGNAVEELVGRPVFELYANTPQGKEKASKVFQRFRAGKTLHDEELQMQKADGTPVWISLTVNAVRDAQGRVVESRSMVVDITERKRAEEALRRSLEETARSQRTLLALSQAAQEVQHARTADEVYQTIGNEVTELGYHAAIFILTGDQTHLVVSHLTFEPALVRAAEKLMGLSAQGYRFPLVPGGFFQRIIAERETTFTDATSGSMAEALPEPLQPLAGRLAALLELEQSIVAPLTIGSEMHGLLVVNGTGLTEADVPAVTTLANQAAIALENAQAQEELQQSYAKLQRALEGTVYTLVSAIEMGDPYTAGHQQRVTQLACAIAHEMGLPEEQIEGLRMAGLIHDLGKINVPSEILSRPGPLSDLQFGLVKMHAQTGHNVLKETHFPWPLADIVLQHHERMNGSGYPQGLSGEEILLEAKILAVADVVEAMASSRPYRPALGVDKALEEVSQNKGILYDPEVVDACLRLFTEKRFTFG
jgi:PAS domain S-box-containing protein